MNKLGLSLTGKSISKQENMSLVIMEDHIMGICLRTFYHTDKMTSLIKINQDSLHKRASDKLLIDIGQVILNKSNLSFKTI